MKTRRIIGICIVLLGLAVIALPYLQNAGDDRAQEASAAELEQLIANGAQDLSVLVNVEEASSDEIETWDADGEIRIHPLPTPVPLNGKISLDRLGIIYIERIDSKQPIVEGAGKTELKHGIGHVSGTAAIGDYGNCVLAGHRNYTYGSMWNRLNEVQIGDFIKVTDANNVVWTYEVYNQLTVEPSESAVVLQQTLKDPEEKRLTLFTCTPVRVASHRLVFQCRLVGEPEMPSV